MVCLEKHSRLMFLELKNLGIRAMRKEDGPLEGWILMCLVCSAKVWISLGRGEHIKILKSGPDMVLKAP